MKKWVLKAIIQKVITYLPFSFHFNYFFQKYVTKSVRLSDNFFDIMLEHFEEFQTYAQKHNASFEEAKLLELGTGWHPIMPLCLFISGAQEIQTVDLRSLVRKENLKVLFQKVVTYFEDGRLQKAISDIKQDRIIVIKGMLEKMDQLTIDQVLTQCNIQLVVRDAQELAVNEGYFDFCYSVNVLEHIDANVIEGLAKEFYRVIKTGGIEYHAIGVYDHFCHIDKSISKFNYLKYSANQWKWIDNGIQPQNRKRISHFRKTFLQFGYTILDEILWEAEPEEITKINVHSDFKNQEDLAIPYGTFILKKN